MSGSWCYDSTTGQITRDGALFWDEGLTEAERDGALWNFIRAVAGRNDIPAEEVERDIEKAIKAVRKES